MRLIAVKKKPDRRDETCRNQKREERLRSRGQHGGGAKHHAPQDEDEKNLVCQVAWRVEQNARCAPAGACATNPHGEDSTPPAEVCRG